MSHPIKPWSIHRQVLWAVGVFGLVLWVMALLWSFFIGGFGPGSDVPRMSLADIPVAVASALPLVYYILVAHHPWTRTLWRIGVVMHAGMLILYFVSVLSSAGGTLVCLPFLLVGPVTWILHARRNNLT